MQDKCLNENSNKDGLSVIVPFYNEQDAIPGFLQEMSERGEEYDFPIEFVFVNDGSTDESVTMLKNANLGNIRRAKLISLSKNFGSHAAVRAGVDQAYYDNCVFIGIDLQEPRELLSIAYDKLKKERCEAVYFEKRTIEIHVLTRAFSKLYSWLIQKYAVSNYHSNGIANVAFGSRIKELLRGNRELNSSIILQIMDAGFDHEIVMLDYGKRSAGTSKWTLSKKIKLFIDSFVSFSFMPIRLVSITGIIVFIIGLAVGVLTIISRLANPEVPIGYATIASILALGFGITNISLGIIAEYLWRTLDAARERPAYIVSEIVEL